MQVRIDHRTTYAYARPARYIVQLLRLTPRSGDGQFVRRWVIDTDVDAKLRRSEDAFGNVVHALYTEAPTNSLTVRVSGDVDTVDQGGLVRDELERLPPEVFLRETDLTRCDSEIAAYVDDIKTTDRLEALHALMSALHRDIVFEVGATTTTHSAAEVLKLRRGVCQDHAHLFIAAARRLGAPARYVSGHMVRSDGRHEQDAAHAWAEAWVPNLGWVGFDPANGICPTDAHVRVAVGLDYLGAAPVRGASYGGFGETLAVSVHVSDVRSAQQSQSQN